jgi:hypothetical protein
MIRRTRWILLESSRAPLNPLVGEIVPLLPPPIARVRCGQLQPVHYYHHYHSGFVGIVGLVSHKESYLGFGLYTFPLDPFCLRLARDERSQ